VWISVSLVQNLTSIQRTIKNACKKSNRKITEVSLLAVSKHQPISKIEEAYGLGLRDFGENYVQELLQKKTALQYLKDIRWHLIGPLQKNKVKQALTHADVFHALDSLNLAKEISKQAQKLKLQNPWPVFIQINLDHSPTKAGVSLDGLKELLDFVLVTPQLQLGGLMCLPEPQVPVERMRESFRKLKNLACMSKKPLKLSMGMSEDYEIAIEEGAHWIRIGRKLFGER